MLHIHSPTPFLFHLALVEYSMHYALRLQFIFSNNWKHFKKYRIMHSHHLKPYDNETNGKKKDRMGLCRNIFFCTSEIYFTI